MEESTQECWMAATQSHLQNSCEPIGPKPQDALQKLSKSTKCATAQLIVLSQPQDEDIKETGAHAWHIQSARSELQTLIEFLNPLGEREGPLKAALEAFCNETEFLNAKNVTQTESSHAEEDYHDAIADKHSFQPFGCLTTCADEENNSEIVPDSGLETAARIREELIQLMHRLPEESFADIRGSSSRRTRWHNRIEIASTPQVGGN